MMLGGEPLSSAPIGSVGVEAGVGAIVAVPAGFTAAVFGSPVALVEPPDNVTASVSSIAPSQQSVVHVGRNYIVATTSGVSAPAVAAPNARYNQTARTTWSRSTALAIPRRATGTFTPSVGMVSKFGEPSAITNGVTGFASAITALASCGTPSMRASRVGYATSCASTNVGRPLSMYTQIGVTKPIRCTNIGSPKRFIDFEGCVYVDSSSHQVEVFTDV